MALAEFLPGQLLPAQLAEADVFPGHCLSAPGADGIGRPGPGIVGPQLPDLHGLLGWLDVQPKDRQVIPDPGRHPHPPHSGPQPPVAIAFPVQFLALSCLINVHFHFRQILKNAATHPIQYVSLMVKRDINLDFFLK